MWKTPQYEK